MPQHSLLRKSRDRITYKACTYYQLVSGYQSLSFHSGQDLSHTHTHIKAFCLLPLVSEKHQVCHLVLVWEDCLRNECSTELVTDSSQWNSEKKGAVGLDWHTFLFWMKCWTESKAAILVKPSQCRLFIRFSLEASKMCNKISPQLVCHINIEKTRWNARWLKLL